MHGWETFWAMLHWWGAHWWQVYLAGMLLGGFVARYLAYPESRWFWGVLDLERPLRIMVPLVSLFWWIFLVVLLVELAKKAGPWLDEEVEMGFVERKQTESERALAALGDEA